MIDVGFFPQEEMITTEDESYYNIKRKIPSKIIKL